MMGGFTSSGCDMPHYSDHDDGGGAFSVLFFCLVGLGLSFSLFLLTITS